MRTSVLGLLGALSLLVGCAKYEYRAPSTPPAPQPVAADVRTEESTHGAGVQSDMAVRETRASGTVFASSVGSHTRTLSSLPGVAAKAGGGAAGPPSSAEAPREARNTDMLKVEARVTLEVDRVGETVTRVRALVAERGGQIISDVFTDAKYERGAAMTLRIASGDTTAFLTAIAGLGRVRSQRVSAEDVSREYHDAQIVLRNLEATMARYEELLKQAKDVKEMLAIENELTRLRTETDRVKGNLTFLRDRVARSVVYLTIQPKPTSEDVEGPDSDFFPGPKGGYFHDFATKKGGAGGGIWLRGRQPVGVEALVFSHDEGPSKSLLVATFGGDIYSSTFGGGRRRTMNLFLGIRAGVAYTKGRTEAIVPIGLGLELLRTEKVSIAADVRGTTSFGNKRGLAFGVMPTLGLNVAF